MNNYFFVSYQKELEDTLKLAEIIEKDKWIDKDTVIVNCGPDYSSITSQIVNHKNSGKELLEQIPLEFPYPTMSQIWNRQEFKYELFDKYLFNWIANNISKDCQYLFIDSVTTTGKNFSKLKSLIRDKADFRFASLYVRSDSKVIPDYHVEQCDENVLFEWENTKNSNWNY